MALSRKPPDKSTAKFFERLPPSFSLESRPENLTFQFLDHSDPDRDKVVRKKAREWVNRNKEDAQKDQCQLRRKPKKRNPDSADSNNAIRLVEQATRQAQSLSLKKVTELRTFDAFNIFPGVQEDRYNILQYFLESPFMWDALPCCDDRHILDNDKTLALSTRDNSIMWNMARGEVSFVVWLYSIVLVRDGMRGLFDTEDARSWYNEALKKIRGELADQMQHGNFSDHLINALACIQATSSFAGMFEAAIIHHSAMTNILKMKGKGDILTGLKQLSTWSRKAIQWCEFFVSAEQVQLPDIPYYCVSEPNLLPRSLLAEAVALTQRSKENLPFFRGPLNTILYQLHQLGLVYAHAPKNTDSDRHAAGTLYDTEYALLQVLSSQRQAKDDFLDVEILLAETLQLYLWVGPRRLRPQTRLCSLLASRVAMALAIFIPNSHEYDDSGSAGPSVTLSHSSSKDYFTRCRTRPRSVNNLIAWSLALSAVAGAAAPISEYQWLEANCALQIQAMGLDNDIDSYRSLLKLFPKVDGFDWIDLEGLHDKIRLSNKD